MSWKFCEMKVVSGDRIRPLMWVKALMYLWECSAKSLEFFSFSEWCPQFEEFLILLDILQDGFASLNGHGFVDGISIPHLCNNFDAINCYIMACPTL